MYTTFFKPFWDEHLDIKIHDLDFYCMNAGYGQIFHPSSELMKRENRSPLYFVEPK